MNPVVLSISIYLLVFAFRCVLRYLNLGYLKRYGDVVPAGFEGALEPELLRKTSAYTMAQSRLSLVESAAGGVILLLFLFGGLLPLYDQWLGGVSESFIVKGVLFFLGLSLIQMMLGIPFSLYRTFKLENRFGFNTMTGRLWISDLLKTVLLSSVILGLVLAGLFALIRLSPGWWWFWGWCFFAAVSIFFMYISPMVIEPLFNKFESVQKEGFEEKVRELMAKADLKVSQVLQVDASRRSKHSNAYFSGIGAVKRIVLFDTLFEQMGDSEILSILAHEVGHWKKGHVLKRICFVQMGSLLFFYLAFRLLEWGGLPAVIGVETLSFYGQLIVLGFLGSLAGFPLTPFFSWLSRRDEWQADRFAVDLTKEPLSLASALTKIARENLSNLHPHPLYAWFYYSHPPIVARVSRLRQDAGR